MFGPRTKMGTFLSLLTFFVALSASVEAADTFRIQLGDSGVGFTRITASFKGSPGNGADIYLQPCSKTITLDCIESVSTRSSDQSPWIDLVVDDKITFPSAGVPKFGSSPDIVLETLTAYAANNDEGFPAGGMSPIYKSKDSNEANSDKFLVIARAIGALNSNGVADWSDIQLEVKPVTITDYSTLNAFGFPTLTLQPTFNNISSFKLKIRTKVLSNLMSGWFYGRILRPEINTTTLSSGGKVIEIIGSPITTNISEGSISFAEYNSIQVKSNSALPTVNPATSVAFFQPTYGFRNGTGAMGVWKYLQPYMGDTSVSKMTVFNIRKSKITSDYYPKGCKASQGLDGVVSTNATMYNPSPPTYDSETSSLNFEVGSPHLDPDGKVIQGVYSLVLGRDIAQCIWGSDLTNFRAAVSISSASGDNTVTTSVLKLNGSYYYFHISGFTYSTKKISVVLKKFEPLPAEIKPVQRKITCIKGALAKIVQGKNPTCPKGYKLKR